MSVLNNSNAISTGGADYNLESSLRFRSDVSAHLERTPTTAGNTKTWTWSGWIKRGKLGAENYLFGSINGGTNSYLYFQSSDKLQFIHYPGTINALYRTSRVFRDTSAWYHIVLAVDTTQATATDRIKLWVNGEDTIDDYNNTIDLNTDTYVNGTYQHVLGSNSTVTHGGYMTEVNFVDGQALTPSDFGETDTTTGVWKPKKYTGTYGTNGFYLNFSDSTSTTTLGYDQSSNSNNWTLNNISLTSGTTYDLMNDVPTLTDEDTANFAVLNPLNNIPYGSVSDGNLKFTGSATDWSGVYSSIKIPSTGKWYAECVVGSTTNNSNQIIFGFQTFQPLSYTATNFYGHGHNSGFFLYNNGTASTNGGFATPAGTLLQIAIDADAGKAWYGYNNNWYDTYNTTNGDPSAGTNPYATGINFSTSDFYFVLRSYVNNGSINFGQRPFAYTPPTGYKKLNTYNLPDSTIVDGSQYFNAVTWAGTGTTNSVTGFGFQPDLNWTKLRDGVAGTFVHDIVRGTSVRLTTYTTGAEAGGLITSFDSDGFTTSNTGSGFNGSGYNYVTWGWSADGTSGVSNTDGTITSTVSANTDSGFSVVTYTGNSSISTVGHGLGIKPSMIIVKNRSSVENWRIYHTSVGATGALAFTTATPTFLSAYWNNTEPTSSVFTVNNAAPEVNENGSNFVAYCFAEVEGFSKFGSYTGNGSADGPFVYTGFRPAFVLVKRTDGVQNWTMYDSARDTDNVVQNLLVPNTSGAEATYAIYDFLSNGFKLRNTDTAFNGSGANYIYMAFAENPFKQSLAR